MVNYAESDDDGDEDPFERLKASRPRRDRKRVVLDDDDEDEYEDGDTNVADYAEDGESFTQSHMVPKANTKCR